MSGSEEAHVPQRTLQDQAGPPARRSGATSWIITMCKLASIIVLILCAAFCLTSCPACATLDAPNDNPNASPKQIVTAAALRQAALDKAACNAHAIAFGENPGVACAALKASAKISAANRAKIDAARAALEAEDAAAAADWGQILDLVIIGFDTATVVVEADKKAKRALSPDISAEELESLYSTAIGNYEASAVMLVAALKKCGG